MSEQTWPTQQQVEELVLAVNMTPAEAAKAVMELFEPFRMVEIRGFLGTHVVGVEEFLKSMDEVRDYRKLKGSEEA